MEATNLSRIEIKKFNENIFYILNLICELQRKCSFVMPFVWRTASCSWFVWVFIPVGSRRSHQTRLALWFANAMYSGQNLNLCRLIGHYLKCAQRTFVLHNVAVIILMFLLEWAHMLYSKQNLVTVIINMDTVKKLT